MNTYERRHGDKQPERQPRCNFVGISANFQKSPIGLMKGAITAFFFCFILI